ncbi:MAG: PP2C family protein-serine/threonine phosphatase [Acidobacteria bacterium]|nr:PP2C family protein-serine/threonine phosphatase [Acidobacteriota bacterium]MBV9476864.1 PP2C family protein-serine/threonine phosphatase [Acidobacteriota bacterium]
MDYKRLLTQVERTLEAIDTSGSDTTTAAVAQIAETIASNFRDQLGITGGRVYEMRDDCYELMARFGQAHDGELGINVPKDYRPIELVLENGIMVMDPTDPGVDPVLEKKLGARRFCAISVGDEDYIVAFNVSPELSREDILFSLNLVRYAINQKMRAQRFESLIVEAQRIQQSILPQRIPQYAGYDIWGRTVPAEIVSGDFYDFIPVSDNILGLAIADGSGHGLPAALVVRDVYMGLRMATDRDFKIVRTLEKLNHIIHRGRLTTKFVSLFYGELETGGILIYCNAGHNPPFIIRANGKEEFLRNGGPVLGPTPDATYTRGFAKLEAGDLVCMYSDGIIEAHDKHDNEFGTERFLRLVKANRQRSAQEIGQEVLARVAKWGRDDEDDRTIVIVKAVQV